MILDIGFHALKYGESVMHDIGALHLFANKQLSLHIGLVLIPTTAIFYAVSRSVSPRHLGQPCESGSS